MFGTEILYRLHLLRVPGGILPYIGTNSKVKVLTSAWILIWSPFIAEKWNWKSKRRLIWQQLILSRQLCTQNDVILHSQKLLSSYQTTFHRGYRRTGDLIWSTGQKRQSICCESDSELIWSLRNSQSIPPACLVTQFLAVLQWSVCWRVSLGVWKVFIQQRCLSLFPLYLQFHLYCVIDQIPPNTVRSKSLRALVKKMLLFCMFSTLKSTLHLYKFYLNEWIL